MAFRVQPKRIDIPDGDPFANDLLERKRTIEPLTSIVGNVEGPCVIAVDAAWGTGKTTFLKMWAAHLRNQGFATVEFNAWETDFAEDPFLAISAEITQGLADSVGGEESTGLRQLRQAVEELVRKAALPVIRLSVSQIPSVGPPLAKLLDMVARLKSNDSLTDYQTTQAAIRRFRCALRTSAAALAESTNGRPLIVFIDELDRCRPSYAVRLLEVAHHFFTVDQVVFVLALDRSELAHSIRAVYGGDFDAAGYLGRFFDIDFRLPSADRGKFLKSLIRALGIDDAGQSLTILSSFFSTSTLGLREVAQATHRLALVLASLSDRQRSSTVVLVVLLILRTLDLDLYRKFIRGQASDKEVVEAVFSRPGLEELRETHEGNYVEAVIVSAQVDPALGDSHQRNEPTSPLLRRYSELVDNPPESLNPAEDPEFAREFNRGTAVMNLLKTFRKSPSLFAPRQLSFQEFVERLELLSDDPEWDPDSEPPRVVAEQRGER